MSAKRGEATRFLHDAVASNTDDCILWPEHWAILHGYGSIGYKGRVVRCHRLALSLATGVPLNDPRDASHGPCHNRRCINPRHLSWATRRQNMGDKKRDGTSLRGENHGRAKLTKQKVLEIRASTGPQKAIASSYGVSQALVSSIKRRLVWGWLD